MASDTPAAGATPFRAKGPSYIATIAIGHGIKHWYLAAFAVFLPLIEKEYALTTGGVALLVTLRQVAGSAPNFFIGYVTDRLRDHWNLLLPASLFACAAGMITSRPRRDPIPPRRSCTCSMAKRPAPSPNAPSTVASCCTPSTP